MGMSNDCMTKLKDQTAYLHFQKTQHILNDLLFCIFEVIKQPGLTGSFYDFIIYVCDVHTIQHIILKVVLKNPPHNIKGYIRSTNREKIRGKQQSLI